MERRDARQARGETSGADAPRPARPKFWIVLRGYDRAEVDAYLDELESATTRPPATPGFRIALRGYDRTGVKAHVEKLLAALPAPTDAAPSA